MGTILNHLRSEDRFNILFFDSTISTWKKNRLVKATNQMKNKAKEMVATIRAEGSKDD